MFNDSKGFGFITPGRRGKGSLCPSHLHQMALQVPSRKRSAWNSKCKVGTKGPAANIKALLAGEPLAAHAASALNEKARADRAFFFARVCALAAPTLERLPLSCLGARDVRCRERTGHPMNTSSEYVTGMQAQLKAWDANVAVLLTESRKADGEARTAYAKRLKNCA